MIYGDEKKSTVVLRNNMDEVAIPPSPPIIGNTMEELYLIFFLAFISMIWIISDVPL